MHRQLTAAMLVLPLVLTLGFADPGNTPTKPAPAKKRAAKEAPKKQKAAAPDELYAAPGFKVELLYTADPAVEGSWIAMCTEPGGHLILSGQHGQPIVRVVLKKGKVERIEKLGLPITEAMGLLWAFDSLYVNGSGPDGFGLYRCRATKNTGKYDEVKLLKRLEGGGEHGPHGLAAGPDGKIYVIDGNHTKVPEGVSPTSPHRNYHEDHLLPRQWDGNGHAAGILAPGGYVVRTDPNGIVWELVLAGFRNAYDLAFNADGELFTFDSDMEWDWGMPWYRPTRVNHCVSGAEFGWRSGTGKWPDYYPDSLPATVNVGIGSPTGVTFGTGARFPAKYQKALYVCDWTYGRLLAVHLNPRGATYTATFENLVAPLGLVKEGAPKKPLNLTDVVIGADGAMYFTIGGRNTQAALYRVSYTGPESTAPANLHDMAGAKERQLRRDLEAFHGRTDPKAVAFAWPYLDDADRFLRYAARIAVESQPVAEWQGKALAEKRPTAALTALLALARYGDPATRGDLVAALEKFPLDSLTAEQKLDKLRVLSLSFLRQGRPGLEATRKILADLDPKFPSADTVLNRELAQVLIYLQAPRIAERCLGLMAAAKSQEDLFHYLFHLRTLPIGQWTLPQRKEYFAYWTDRKKFAPLPEMARWFAEAGRPYSDGSSFKNFLKNFLRDAALNLSSAEREALAGQLKEIDKAAIVSYDIKPRPVVKQWRMADLLPDVGAANHNRNFERGKEAYLAGQCIKCHRFGNEGGAVGPDLTAIAARFSRRDMLESILEPSKVISDQYQNELFATAKGTVVTGRVVDETPDRLVIQPEPLLPNRVEMKKSDLESRTPSKVSPMPAGLVDVLTREEILDLMAYLESMGNKNHAVFRK